MKKSALFYVLLLVSCFLCFSMSRSSDLVQANGFIRWFGNAPVEYAGFETVEGKLYTLAAAEGASFSLKDMYDLSSIFSLRAALPLLNTY